MLLLAGVTRRPGSGRHALSVVRSVSVSVSKAASASCVSSCVSKAASKNRALWFPVMLQQLQQQQQQQQQRSFASSSSSKKEDPEGEVQKKNKKALAVSLFKNPIVHQLWTARVAAKERQRKTSTGTSSTGKTTTGTSTSTASTPNDSRVEISYPFTTDQMLHESYRNPWGQMRLGKMMEDLDALAGNIAFFHVDNHAGTNNDNTNDIDGGTIQEQQQAEHPVIVTASVDRIRLRQRPEMDSDQHLSGQVTWTGTSSMEICMQCTGGGSSGGGSDQNQKHNADSEWLQAYVTFVTLDPVTKKPTAIPAVHPQTDEEIASFQAGAARAAAKKKRRHQKKTLSPETDDLADRLLAEAGPLLNMPSLADPHSILMDATKMQNAMIAQPQVQNLHNRIFGGFLMRRAFELAFSNAYVFGGARPLFLQMDDVSFASPVDVGDLLVFNSRVLYTDTARLKDYYNNVSVSSANPGGGIGGIGGGGYDPDQQLPLVHIEVEAWVTEPEKASARLSNSFYFTFAVVSKSNVGGDSDSSSSDSSSNNSNMPRQVRRVLPANIDQARRMAMRMLVDQEQE
jgi:acyl-coenzyme A thioesterase 9